MPAEQHLIYERTGLSEIIVRPVLLKRLYRALNRFHDLLKLNESLSSILAPSYNDPNSARLVRLRYKFSDVLKVEVKNVSGGQTAVVKSELTYRDGATERMTTVWVNTRMKSGIRTFLLSAGPLFEPVSLSINK